MSNILKIAPELLKSGVKILLEARGKSMLPVFGPGDRLTVEPCGFDAIQEGDIVVYENAHEPKEIWLVAHRVVKKEASAKGYFLLTKGESPLQDQETLLDAGAVLGKVVHIKKVGRVGRLFRWIQRRIR